MKRILCISGSRADYGLLEWPVKVLGESFDVQFARITPRNPAEAFEMTENLLNHDCLLILGDRWEILQAAIAAHLQRVPIAHIGGGDVTLGSYDDAMRDCISMLAKWNFATSQHAMDRLMSMHLQPVYNIGNIAVDYIMQGDWKGTCPYPYVPEYVVVSYQPETIDGTIEWADVLRAIGHRFAVFIRPNSDAGSDEINAHIDAYCKATSPWGCAVIDSLPHAKFLNVLSYATEFIGNSSAMLYEAPALGVKCRMIGKRQQGRVAPSGDGKASERIREVLSKCL